MTGPHLPVAVCRRSTRPLTATDADEVRRFAEFLSALNAAGIRTRTPEQRREAARLYAEHYPEDTP